MTNPESERLVRIEEQLAHLERYVEQLDIAVRELATRIERMPDELTEVKRELRADVEEMLRRPEDERPPHW